MSFGWCRFILFLRLHLVHHRIRHHRGHLGHWIHHHILLESLHHHLIHLRWIKHVLHPCSCGTLIIHLLSFLTDHLNLVHVALVISIWNVESKILLFLDTYLRLRLLFLRHWFLFLFPNDIIHSLVNFHENDSFAIRCESIIVLAQSFENFSGSSLHQSEFRSLVVILVFIIVGTSKYKPALETNFGFHILDISALSNLELLEQLDLSLKVIWIYISEHPFHSLFL